VAALKRRAAWRRDISISAAISKAAAHIGESGGRIGKSNSFSSRMAIMMAKAPDWRLKTEESVNGGVSAWCAHHRASRLASA